MMDIFYDDCYLLTSLVCFCNEGGPYITNVVINLGRRLMSEKVSIIVLMILVDCVLLIWCRLFIMVGELNDRNTNDIHFIAAKTFDCALRSFRWCGKYYLQSISFPEKRHKLTRWNWIECVKEQTLTFISENLLVFAYCSSFSIIISR